MSITEGQSVTLRASIPGASDIRWILNGEELGNSELYRYGVSGNEQTLTVRSVSQRDRGIITCQAQTQQGLVRCRFDTEVRAGPSAAPHFLLQPRSQNVDEGQNVKFTCEIAGEPSPDVEWLKDNMTVSFGLLHNSGGGRSSCMRLLVPLPASKRIWTIQQLSVCRYQSIQT